MRDKWDYQVFSDFKEWPIFTLGVALIAGIAYGALKLQGYL